jgi:hypothetical protein
VKRLIRISTIFLSAFYRWENCFSTVMFSLERERSSMSVQCLRAPKLKLIFMSDESTKKWLCIDIWRIELILVCARIKIQNFLVPFYLAEVGKGRREMYGEKVVKAFFCCLADDGNDNVPKSGLWS